MIEGTVETVGEVDVGEGGQEAAGRVDDLGAVEGDLPLPEHEWSWSGEPGWDAEEGDSEDVTCELLISEFRERAAFWIDAAHQSRMLKR